MKYSIKPESFRSVGGSLASVIWMAMLVEAEREGSPLSTTITSTVYCWTLSWSRAPLMNLNIRKY